MIRRPPRSTLFPTRRSSDLMPAPALAVMPRSEQPLDQALVSIRGGIRYKCIPERLRSEEHTSELQSLRHLVCRLLLEKKKAQPTINTGNAMTPSHDASTVFG